MVRSSLNFLSKDSKIIQRRHEYRSHTRNNFNDHEKFVEKEYHATLEKCKISPNTKTVVIVGMNGLLVPREIEDDSNYEENDGSSVSSLESYGSVTSRYRGRKEVKTTRRILFPRYWETNPVSVKRNRSLSEGTSTTCASTYASFNESPRSHKPISELPPFRRSVFLFNTASTPTLINSSPLPTRQQPFRKTVSTSEIMKKKPCLRTGPDIRRNNSSHSVTFNPQVAVYEFERTHENYAQKGWSKRFH